ncbi:MAG: homocysteine S-methyltransferase family protein [Rikenellaceae bacterium]
MDKLSDLLEKRCAVLDGAMGTMIQNYQLSEEDFRADRFAHWSHPLKGVNDILSLTKPEIISEIHRGYLEAGADIITTNTFNSSSVTLSEYGLADLSYEINFASAKLAKSVAEQSGKECWVAGSIGPTSHALTIEPFMVLDPTTALTYDELRDSYTRQMEGLLDGGVDLILVETAIDILNVQAAVEALETLCTKRGANTPLMVSLTVDNISGRTISGHSPLEIYDEIKSSKLLFSMGLNCGFGAEVMLPYLEELANGCDVKISAYPNAGLPDGSGHYNQTPEMMLEALSGVLDKNTIDIVGGCCGTTYDHIALIAKKINL